MTARITDLGSERLWRALNVLGLVLLVAAVLPFVTAAFPAAIGAEEAYVVSSGSMEPAIGVGDLIYVYGTDPAAIGEGDVITYDVDGDGEVTTHRVVEVLETENGRQFRTKGDANEEPDQYRVPAEAVVGRVTVSLPWVGRAVVFANSRLGVLTLVVLPAALLVLNEVYTLGRAYMVTRSEGGETEPDTETGSGSGGDD